MLPVSRTRPIVAVVVIVVIGSGLVGRKEIGDRKVGELETKEMSLEIDKRDMESSCVLIERAVVDVIGNGMWC